MSTHDEGPGHHILLVDDDQRIRTLLEKLLRQNGFLVTSAGDAALARRKLSGLAFDAAVVDIMMPGEDGLSLLAHLKDLHALPVLMLTALSEPDARVKGLECGADDYLGKPFDPRELVLRLNNLMRRKPQSARRVTFGAFVFDSAREELTRAGNVVRLTDKERALLRQFAARPGITVPRHALIDETVSDRAVDVQINRLRRKLEVDPASPVHLQTVRGSGYRLNAELEEDAP